MVKIVNGEIITDGAKAPVAGGAADGGGGGVAASMGQFLTRRIGA
jgi:hypothetical protein